MSYYLTPKKKASTARSRWCGRATDTFLILAVVFAAMGEPAMIAVGGGFFIAWVAGRNGSSSCSRRRKAERDPFEDPGAL